MAEEVERLYSAAGDDFFPLGEYPHQVLGRAKGADVGAIVGLFAEEWIDKGCDEHDGWHEQYDGIEAVGGVVEQGGVVEECARPQPQYAHVEQLLNPTIDAVTHPQGEGRGQQNNEKRSPKLGRQVHLRPPTVSVLIVAQEVHTGAHIIDKGA